MERGRAEGRRGGGGACDFLRLGGRGRGRAGVRASYCAGEEQDEDENGRGKGAMQRMN